MKGSGGGSSSRLAAVLAAREARAERQAELLARTELPLLSLTLVSPGAEKSGPEFTAFIEFAEAALRRELASRGLLPGEGERREGAEGPELLLPVGGAEGDLETLGIAVKKACLALEEGEPWGRLLDLDVLVQDADSAPRTLRREELGYPPRGCLLCEASALECRYALRHRSEELAARASALRSGALGSRAGEERPSRAAQQNRASWEGRLAPHPEREAALAPPEASGLAAGRA